MKNQQPTAAALWRATADMLADALEDVMQGKQLPQKAREFLELRRSKTLDSPVESCMIDPS